MRIAMLRNPVRSRFPIGSIQSRKPESERINPSSLYARIKSYLDDKKLTLIGRDEETHSLLLRFTNGAESAIISISAGNYGLAELKVGKKVDWQLLNGLVLVAGEDKGQTELLSIKSGPGLKSIKADTSIDFTTDENEILRLEVMGIARVEFTIASLTADEITRTDSYNFEVGSTPDTTPVDPGSLSALVLGIELD